MGNKIELYYQKIANIINDMVPEEWLEVKLYGENQDGGQTVFFYYRSTKTNEWVNYARIPELFEGSVDQFKSMRRELSFGIILDFKKAYQEEVGEPWISFQMSLHSSGKFNIHFNHEKNPLDPMLTQVAWAYEQLGIIPDDTSFEKTLLNEYLEEKAQGKRYPFLEPLKEE
ncbi:DUF600 family protein [Halalkalibacterium halodurans]|uniref:immunity protein YezG family protein n=1 Tax=Halalkalibacterium halodurans TaxID=86665 RepID=UPI002AA9F04A|nr:immunity protein YezG family protein [Halalkalibacterium halodurans]MDY7224206.1 DUF600 family protein [Halalkalibacterium halodurans]MDY7243491.1 DUF600 family protein [Halalkalibacterium halodurans]MED4079444.1 DUF600 family protein [Halalkalibacterium halodurans]MED4085055.1 DUF600 family protein [Halalkalibacterium halodurans]MED4105928.1 DUF600 family protein [Halalkalibacterium halodurans]